MRLFHLYQTVYSFRGIVFTDSLAVEDFAKKQGLLVMKNVQVNKYGLPFVKNMIARMVTTVPALYYGYCNSDILINPSIFDALPLIQSKVNNHILPGNFSLISRVKVVSSTLPVSVFSSIDNLKSNFYSIRSSPHRNKYCIVLFNVLISLNRTSLSGLLLSLSILYQM